MEPELERLRRARLHLRDDRHVVHRLAARDAALDRDRALPDRDRTSQRLAAPIATMVELLAAIPSVVLGLWGILVFGPWVATHLEPWLQSTVRLPADLLGRSVAGGRAAGGSRPDDHDHPDHVGDLPRALQPCPTRSHRRVACARLDTVGGDPPRLDPVRGTGDLCGRAARARPGFRRGDRRHAGDRSGNTINRSLFPPGDTLASKIAATYQGASSNIEIASLALSRRDPARHLARHQRRRPGDRRTGSRRHGGCRPDEQPPRSSIRTTSPPARTTSGVASASRSSSGLLALLSALFAVALLALVLGTVLLKGISEIKISFFTKLGGALRREGRDRRCAGRQRHHRRAGNDHRGTRSRSSSRSTSPSTRGRRPHRSSASCSIS